MRYLFIFLFCASLFAQEDDGECLGPISNTSNFTFQNTTDNTTNGLGFTPAGEIRALVIYVNAEEQFLNNASNQISTWPVDKEFPIHNGQSVVNPDGTLIWAHSDSSQFNTNMNYGSSDEMLNISEYYYHMSGGKFKFYAETLMDPGGTKPISIRINPSNLNGSYSNLFTAVKNKINAIYPVGYDWSRFDNRKNKNSWTISDEANFSDNVSDNIIDYIILVVRNKNNWSNHPFNHPNTTSGVSWPKAFAGLSSITGQSLSIPYSAGTNNHGHVYLRFHNNLENRIELHIHEMAHNFMNMPHVNTTNAAVGNYFHFGNGLTLMDKYVWFMPMANAWELWINGWIELGGNEIDENNYDPNKVIIIKDILTERTALKVKLPHVCDQSVWFQNHNVDLGEYSFYKRPFSLSEDGDGNPAPQPNLGLYAFVENLSGEDGRRSGTNFSNANSFKPLHGLGNFDFRNKGPHVPNPSWAYNNLVYEFETVEPNAFSDRNIASYHWEEGMNGFSNTDGTLHFNTAPNGIGGLSNIEAYRMWKVDGNQVWGNLGGNMNITQQKLSAFSNPPITNIRRSNHGQNNIISMQPTILHSLSIRLEYHANGDVSAIVDYEDGVIHDDFRATGNMLIPDSEQIILDDFKLLHIDKTGSANRKHELNDGTFFEPTRLVVDSGGKLSLNKNSKVLLENESTLIFKTGSVLDLKPNSKILVKSGSYLCIDAGANIVNPDQMPKVIVNGGFYDGPLNLVDTSVTSFAGFPTTADVNVLCTSTDDEYLHNTIEVNLPSSSCGNLIVNSGDNLKITSSTMVTFENSVLIESGSNFEAHIVDINVGDCNPAFDLSLLACSTSLNSRNPIPFGSFNKNKDFNRINDISVHPNPTGKSAVLNISFFGNSTEVYDIKLFDLNGRLLLDTTREPDSRDLQLDISDLTKGVYIIRAMSLKDQFVKKVIIN